MATAKPDTGHGFSITFATSAFTGKLRGVPTNLTRTLPVVNISHAATSGQQETMPGDLQELGEVEVDVLYEAVVGLPTTGVVETITITYPLQASGATVAANTAGTGFIVMVGDPAFVTNQEMLAKIRFKFDGATGPTFTPAS